MTCPLRVFPLRMKSLVGCTSYIAAQKEEPNTSTIQQHFEIPKCHPQEGNKKKRAAKKKTQQQQQNTSLSKKFKKKLSEPAGLLN